MSTEKAIYVGCSNAGFFPVSLYVVPTEGGVEINIESSDDYNYRPRVKIPSNLIAKIGEQLQGCGSC